MTVQQFEFAFDSRYRVAGLPFGVVPRTARVEVGEGRLRCRFGPWHLDTPVDNVTQTSETGGYGFLKTAGPPHLSFTDRGVTFATNGDRGVCVRFAAPVRAIDPTGLIRHPGATFTVADVDGLRAALERAS
ncbi:hypothetical protein H9L10_02050 [Phycicoccus endophyticus]|uniref:Uncharacterized protein n=1 Tax=Phycicoccus endophyticus TaxID=1690220 RepID=A0A7G9R2R9_9MICO|nr:hypothetical protein [Phycicoccus endophyticus]NHI20361.1 hypothetical protein [Phycicoccus endophyticus]QNN49894.1 hypothetical protein H9L10_02050 [Phycicoccus endophyticus]GGL29854.1 hypothetical protein GCM10012283_10270 [Phycicoccus endophyticus]